METSKIHNKIKTLYKGDVYAGMFYLLVGFLSTIAAISLYFFAPSLGYFYLSIGLSILAIYMIGKGSVMIYHYYNRYQFYKKEERLSTAKIKEEKTYVDFRANKKQNNRRLYIYTVVIGSVVAFLGIFTQEKGMIVSTCTPIVLIAAIEFSVGLLTQFRLSELSRQLAKEIR